MKNTFRKCCAVMAWTVLILQYIIMLQGGEFGGFAATTLTYFGFFTILTNILVALAFSTPFFKPKSRLYRFFSQQSVRAAIALYILVVGIVYYALLANAHNPQGLSAILNVGLHFFLPVLYIMDWLIFADKDAMSYKHLPFWVAYPMVYGLFNIIRGAWTGFYPYPFLNISELGLGSVFVNMMVFTLIYGLGGAVFIWFGRFFKRKAI